MTIAPFDTAIAHHVWDTRYRLREGDRVVDRSIEETWARVARAVAAAEPEPDLWAERFRAALRDFRFLPGGRILAGAGTDRRVTLFNCYVMGAIPDDMEGIFEALKQGALTMQQGGGVGYDFSTLRPRGSEAREVGTVASGPVSFMRVWDSMCATVLSTGARRGAMMATLRCDHPDIFEFVTAKRDPGQLRHFNVSVLATDAFVRAVQQDEEWPLVFPSGDEGGAPQVVRTVRARELWAAILRNTWDHAEPGVLFVDRINAENNLWYRERISATNPCGEIPLQPYGACDLGSIDLVPFVRGAFTAEARLDLDGIAALVPVAVRFLDDVVDVSRFPLPEQEAQARGTRRLGLGITGLGDALAMLGLHYGTEEARALASRVMRVVRDAAWEASVALAREKGPFPFFDRDRFLEGAFVKRLPERIRQGIGTHGVRNSHLLAIAPAGTISLLANNVSSGIEPLFALRYRRDVLTRDGERSTFDLEAHAVQQWRRLRGDAPLPDTFVTAMELSPEQHLLMGAALQEHVDNAISKTINVPPDADFERFEEVYELAWRLGLKGCTTWRPNAVTGAVLQTDGDCGVACGIEREE